MIKNYIEKSLSIKKSDLFIKKSLSAYSYRKIRHKNMNFIYLEQLLSENKKGYEPGSDKYIKFSNNYFIRISDMSDNNFIISETIKTLKAKPPLLEKPILKKGDICYQTASNVGNVCFYDGVDAYYNSHIRKLDFTDNKYYIFSLLKSSFCKNQVDVGGSIKGVDNFSEKYLLKTKILFPTINNNINPKDIEQLVSLITQNIIDKEKQIKLKNKIINEKIINELRLNQNQNESIYSYPRISEIKANKRIDTGLYSKDYKENIKLIENYKNNYFTIDFKNIKTGQTPPDYYYPSYKINKSVYNWLSPKNLKDNILYNKLFIHTKATSTLNNFDIIFGSRGSVGDLFFYDKEVLGECYINQSTSGIKINGNIYNKVYVLCFFSSSIFKKIMSKYIYTGTVPAITPDILQKFKIPKFSEKKQKEISKEYYNKVKNINHTSLDLYLKNEITRNKNVGIFQLNIEILNLKEQLEDIIDKIIMDTDIDIDNYISDNKS